MSGVRGSVTPTGKRTASTFDYPLTNSQQVALSTPISIQPRASPRAATSAIVAANAAINMAQSCPTFSAWQPPPAPAARPRLASVDPPPMELPPSPPVFSPMQQEAVKGKKEESTSVALKKQIYSRSLSNYSSSAPTHVDYLSKFHPNLGGLEEAGVDEFDSDEEDSAPQTGYKPSARAVNTQPQRPDFEDDSPTNAGLGVRAQAIKTTSGASRIQQMQRNDDFSLSKSPTIFSIMSTSQHNAAAPGLHTADTSQSSSSSGSPGHSILGSIAAGAETTGAKRRSITSNKPPMTQQQTHDAHQLASPEPNRQDSNEDDLQFSISLTDEQEGEAEDGQQQEALNLY